MLPPLTDEYDRIDERQWVNRYHGTVICWNDQQGLYQCYQPTTGDWFWWGFTPSGRVDWIPYQVTRQRTFLRADFWVHSIIGFVIFVWAAANGVPGGGAAVFLMLCGTGLGASWLRSRHPTAYDVVAAAGLLGAARGTWNGVHRH